MRTPFYLALAASTVSPWTLALHAADKALPTPTTAAVKPDPVVWDLTELYADEAAWQAERARLGAEFPQLAARAGSLRDGAALQAALDHYWSLRQAFDCFASYAGMKQSEDNRAAANNERMQVVGMLAGDFGTAFSWFEPEVLALGETTIRAWIESTLGLQTYRKTLEDTLRAGPHTLGAEAEKALSTIAPALGASEEVYNLLSNADIVWPKVTLSDGQEHTLDQTAYGNLRALDNRADRKAVFDTFWKTYRQYETTFGATYYGNVQAAVLRAKVRNHPSALGARLFGENLPEPVYRTLIDEVHRGLPALHRYLRLRADIMGIKDMRYYDIYNPVVRDTRPPESYGLRASEALTLQAVAPLGADYQRRLAAGFAAHWTHAYPQPGKSPGAYMNGSAYAVHPYILLNHTNDFDSLSTLAHEWGHGMHSVYTNEAQPFHYADYSLFVAEIASITNEMLLSDHLLAQAKTPQEKIFLHGMMLEQIRGTFFRQSKFAEFELLAHETVERGEPLSGPRLTELYLGLLRRYYGEAEGVMTIDPEYAIEWAFIPHFYSNFYVYNYATSIAAAAWFAERIQAGDTAVRDAYLTMLKSGASAPPYELVRRAGLDMASPAPYRALVERANRTIEAIETLRQP